MLLNVANAGASQADERARFPGGAEQLSRRSFLVGSALGIGAFGLGGCGTSDSLFLAEARNTYGPMPGPVPAGGNPGPETGWRQLWVPDPAS